MWLALSSRGAPLHTCRASRVPFLIIRNTVIWHVPSAEAASSGLTRSEDSLKSRSSSCCVHESRDQDRCHARRSLRLEGIVADRNAKQKHVKRARVILATDEGCGTNEIMRRSQMSKPVVWLSGALHV